MMTMMMIAMIQTTVMIQMTVMTQTIAMTMKAKEARHQAVKSTPVMRMMMVTKTK